MRRISLMKYGHAKYFQYLENDDLLWKGILLAPSVNNWDDPNFMMYITK